MPVKKIKSKPQKKRKPQTKRKTPLRKAKVSVSKGKKAKAAVLKRGKARPKEVVLGVITHYYPRVSVAVIKLQKPLKSGDKIHIKGHTTDLKETADSIQIEHTAVKHAKKGSEIGLLVSSRVRPKDIVYKTR